MENTTMNSQFHRKYGTLISINSHCNDGLYMPWRANLTSIVGMNDALVKLMKVPLQSIYPGAAGLFDQVVCVYPWWRPSNDIFKFHTNYIGVWEESICLCSVGNNSTLNESHCHVAKSGVEALLDPEKCQQLSERWSTMIMQDIYAQTRAKDTSNTSPTLLAVHLDFFAIDNEDVLGPLQLHVIGAVETQISGLLCPESVDEESHIDSWFQQVLQVDSASFDIIDQLIYGQHLPLCSHKKTKNRMHMKALLSAVSGLSPDQRKHLAAAGLCIDSGMVATDTEEPQSLSVVVCNGQLARRLVPAVARRSHKAGIEEITLQFEKVVQYLSESVKEPQIIAIVRSTRLGLVSPSTQASLESLLLTHLHSLYHLNHTDTIYHPSLLGGASGWSNRL